MPHHSPLAAIVTVFAVLSAIPAAAQTVPAQTVPAMGHTEALAIARLPSKTVASLTVTSPAFAKDGDIPLDDTQYGTNRFPGLIWSAGPQGTRSYVVIIQGAPDRPGAPTSVHLTVINLPPSVTRLDPGFNTLPAGAAYGPNVHGLGQAYAGPHTHTSDKQAYHFEVFALDTTIAATPDISFEAIEAAMDGHVLASGDLIAYAAKPAS